MPRKLMTEDREPRTADGRPGFSMSVVRTAGMLLIVAAAAIPAAGQIDNATVRPPDASRINTPMPTSPAGNVPGIGELMDVLEKATSQKSGGATGEPRSNWW